MPRIAQRVVTSCPLLLVRRVCWRARHLSIASVECRRVNPGGSESLECCETSSYLSNPTNLVRLLALQQLSTDLIQFNIGIATDAKIRFTGQHTDQLMKIDGYVLLRKDCSKKKGGGT